MNEISLIIFDMDGLMYDTEAVSYLAYEECMKERGLVSSREEYLGCVGLDMRATCEFYRDIFGQDFAAEELFYDVGRKMFEIIDRDGIPTKPGLYELIDAMDEKGYRKVVASGSAIETIQKYLKQSNLTQRFDAIYSSDHVKRGKPFPDVFLRVCEAEGVDPTQVLVLEDSPAGILAAHAGGMKVIGIPDLIPYSEEIQGKCLAVGETLKDVIPHI